MIERADQLVLNYVSKAADAAHGVLRADQRLDFAKRLRARIEVERHGSQSAREVAKVLARFGDPAALVEREARRLAEQGVPTKRDLAPRGRAGHPGGGGVGGRARGVRGRSPPSWTTVTRRPASARTGGSPQERLDQQRQGHGLPLAGLRRAAMSSANPMATGGRDARTIVKEQPRDVSAMVILVVGGAALVPIDLPPLAIFEVPVVVWAVGAALVLFSESWKVRDKFLGIGAPLLGYSVGGVLIGGLRVGIEAGMQAFVEQFFDVSGTMFMIGTGVGVVWLAYRLLDVS
ncbi:hypothetical protein [Nonomuraea rubra]|uniref:hypothetical protein n=1 Tax=Nonomuraea rubra TaxID=46180 RepID=UPI0031E92AD1